MTSVSMLRYFQRAYNRALKVFFGYNNYASATAMLLQLRLLSANSVLHNARVRFSSVWSNCGNSIVRHLMNVGIDP